MSGSRSEGTSDAAVRHRWSESARFLPRLVVQPTQRFMDSNTSGAIVMLAAAVLALVLANTPWGAGYERLWGAEVSLGVGSLDGLSGLTLREWVTDGAMAFFFFVVALEIKREMVSGDLRDPRAAALPILAAVGGMVVPALLYLSLNGGGPAEHGWGVPMATDIAFAVAVVTAAGPRVPAGARLFLLTLAIVDDLGAIAVIAVFYTSGLSLVWLLAAVATMAAGYALQRVHVRALLPYAVLAAGCWYALHESGVHATIAGVAFGFLTPAWSFYDPRWFPRYVKRVVAPVEEVYADDVLSHREYAVTQNAVRDMRRLAVETQAPLDRLESALTPWVTFVVVPLFAFANAGLVLPDNALTAWVTDDVALGVVLGLVLGKTVGVFGVTWLAIRARIGVLPPGTTWRHILGVAMTAGVGFTVALFVGELAFSDPTQGESAKLGIFVGSAISGVLGFMVLRSGKPPADPPPDPASR